MEIIENNSQDIVILIRSFLADEIEEMVQELHLKLKEKRNFKLFLKIETHSLRLVSYKLTDEAIHQLASHFSFHDLEMIDEIIIITDINFSEYFENNNILHSHFSFLDYIFNNETGNRVRIVKTLEEGRESLFFKV